MPRRTLLFILATALISYVCYQRADRNPYGHYFAEVLRHIDNSYVEAVDDQKLFDGAVDGMLGRLDDYSSFTTREEKAEFQESLDQEFGGVGLELAVDPKAKGLMVISPMVGTPAYEAGIHAGDRIVHIDDVSTEGWDLKDAVEHLRGRPGTPVTLQVTRAGQEKPLKFDLHRAIVQLDSVRGYSRRPDGSWNCFILPNERIGYLRILSFGEHTAQQLADGVKKLEGEGMKGLVLDLRNNPGGLLQASTEICDFFLPLPGKPIVTTRGRDGEVRETFSTKGLGENRRYPIVLLVNRYSASASEIVAACLQDYRRAEIVGERTWGKGTVQNVIPVEGGQSLLKLTVASYWRPSGKNIHRLKDKPDSEEWGVIPEGDCNIKYSEDEFSAWVEYRRKRDMELPSAGPPSDANLGEDDPQLAKALDQLRYKLTARPQQTAGK